MALQERVLDNAKAMKSLLGQLRFIRLFLTCWPVAALVAACAYGCHSIVKPSSTWERLGAITSLAFHPYRSILTVAWAQEIAFLDFKEDRVLSVWRFASDGSGVRWVHFNPDGSIFYTASSNHRPLESNCLRLPPISNTIEFSPLHGIPGINPAKILREWYEGHGICHTCSLRLCVWAAGLVADSSFPHRRVPLSEAVDRILTDVALTVPNGSAKVEDIMALRREDPSPNAVVVIEDFPSSEWFLSKGPCNVYCSAAQPSMMCCLGHIGDLFLTHRDLMRYSLCRRCLQKFWRWANDSNRVQWFTWTQSSPNPRESRKSAPPQIPDPGVVRSARVCYRCCQGPDQCSTHPNAVSVRNELSPSSSLKRQSLTPISRSSVAPTVSLHFDATATAEAGECKKKYSEGYICSNDNSGLSGVGNYSGPNYLSKQSLVKSLPSALALASEKNQPRNNDLEASCKCGDIALQAAPMDEMAEKELRVLYSHLFSSEKNTTSLPFSLQHFASTLANIFQEMGEHSSACNLRNTTHSVCGWELKFRTSVNGTRVCPTIRDAAPCTPRNYAVTYRRDTLVIPQARIFNDSSISLSRDGRLIAAFAVPHGNQQNPDSLQVQDSTVAVYWAEPVSRRGHCIFAVSTVPPAEPVCLHFSPSGSSLVVGTANSPLAVTHHVPAMVQQYNAMFARIINYESPALAYIYAIDRKRKDSVEQSTRVKEVFRFDPPDFMKSPYGFTPMSLNTILWHCGGIAYGTTRGLIVMMEPRLQNDLKDASSKDHF
ncbi:hypothetical protein ECG_03817 [Echinococcus granulosus]|uniref:Activating molecule in BECN1 regulated autophagy n=1 Tax=Echinococcus granulosus TaxID=6210 RepID=A0A068WHJ9_ECHGR|nr:hypothetical protein ECG_03817 [Echinococcus granulosus]CDS17918.1 activating molecule in BECN1 regulated autophagy [Echinococcus granulosus]